MHQLVILLGDLCPLEIPDGSVRQRLFEQLQQNLLGRVPLGNQRLDRSTNALEPACSGWEGE